MRRARRSKNPGDNVAHDDGHGAQHLSVGLAPLMLAFLGDQTRQRWGALWQAVWAKLGSKRLLWERMRAVCFDDALGSMRQWLEALFDGLQKSAPLFADDASYSLMTSLACQLATSTIANRDGMRALRS